MRYKVFPSDSKKFYILDVITNTIMLHVSNKRLAESVADDLNKLDQEDVAKSH